MLYTILYSNIMYNIQFNYCTISLLQLNSIVQYCTIFKARTILYYILSNIISCIVQCFMVLSRVQYYTLAVTLHESRSSGFGCKPHKPAQFSSRDEHNVSSCLWCFDLSLPLRAMIFGYILIDLDMFSSIPLIWIHSAVSETSNENQKVTETSNLNDARMGRFTPRDHSFVAPPIKRRGPPSARSAVWLRFKQQQQIKGIGTPLPVR
jgi:hypothetical protein